jgi:hypothetical protein
VVFLQVLEWVWGKEGVDKGMDIKFKMLAFDTRRTDDQTRSIDIGRIFTHESFRTNSYYAAKGCSVGTMQSGISGRKLNHSHNVANGQ